MSPPTQYDDPHAVTRSDRSLGDVEGPGPAWRIVGKPEPCPHCGRMAIRAGDFFLHDRKWRDVCGDRTVGLPAKRGAHPLPAPPAAKTRLPLGAETRVSAHTAHRRVIRVGAWPARGPGGAAMQLLRAVTAGREAKPAEPVSARPAREVAFQTALREWVEAAGESCADQQVAQSLLAAVQDVAPHVASHIHIGQDRLPNLRRAVTFLADAYPRQTIDHFTAMLTQKQCVDVGVAAWVAQMGAFTQQLPNHHGSPTTH